VTINDSSDSRTQGSLDKKKQYEPPSFRFERVFEVSALSCGKVNPTQFTCHANRKNS
jgi:hypothetical protein